MVNRPKTLKIPKAQKDKSAPGYCGQISTAVFGENQELAKVDKEKNDVCRKYRRVPAPKKIPRGRAST